MKNILLFSNYFVKNMRKKRQIGVIYEKFLYKKTLPSVFGSVDI